MAQKACQDECPLFLPLIHHLSSYEKQSLEGDSGPLQSQPSSSCNLSHRSDVVYLLPKTSIWPRVHDLQPLILWMHYFPPLTHKRIRNSLHALGMKMVYIFLKTLLTLLNSVIVESKNMQTVCISHRTSHYSIVSKIPW